MRNQQDSKLEIFKALSSFNWGGYNLYFGEYYKADNLPWHYIPVWMIITIPIFYLFLFLYGSINLLIKLFNKFINSKSYSLNSLWDSEKDLNDVIYFVLFLVPILIVIFLNSTIYNGFAS